MLRGLLSRFTRGGAAGRARATPSAGTPARPGGTRRTDEAVGRGVRKLLRRAR